MEHFRRYILQTLSAFAFFILATNPLCAQNTDINLLKDINVHRNRRLDGMMTGVTNSVFPMAVGVPVAGLVTGYLRHDKVMMENSAQTIVGLGLSTVITVGLKYGVNRNRPYVTYPFIQPYKNEPAPSFPSGHTSMAFSLATSVSLNMRRWYVVAPAYVWATTAGYSRMHLGVHYPSDVLGGAVVGVGSAWLAYEGDKWLKKRKKARNINPSRPPRRGGEVE